MFRQEWIKQDLKAVIFDMDGVLLDSERAVNLTWEIIGEKNGFSNAGDVAKRCTGCTRAMNRKIFKEVYGQDFPYDDYSAQCRLLYAEMAARKEIPLKPGVSEILTALKKNGIKIALATSTNADIALPELESHDILHFFDVKTCGDQVVKSKPDPEIFLLAAKLMEETPDKVMVIEDSYNGVRAGRNAGMFTVMVPDTLPPTPEMEEKADLIVESLNLLLEKIFV